MPKFVYIDNSNVFIEGKRVSAVHRGLAMNIYDAMNNQIFDDSYRIDFGKLHRFVSGNEPSQISRAILFGSRPPQNDSLWELARQAGFEVVVEDRNVANREKKIDTGIVAAMTRDAYTKVNKHQDSIVLVAGDGDYVPAIRQLIEDGYTVEVVFWSNAAQELKDWSTFTSLDPHLSTISLG